MISGRYGKCSTACRGSARVATGVSTVDQCPARWPDASAGHFGFDDVVGGRDQYISLHLFRLQVLRQDEEHEDRSRADFDESARKSRNSFAVSLTCDGTPLPNKELDVWYVERCEPGYDSFNAQPLEERMKIGGHLLKVRTGPDGIAHVSLPGMRDVKNPHLTYQLVSRFNIERSDPGYKTAQTPQFEFYENSIAASSQLTMPQRTRTLDFMRQNRKGVTGSQKSGQEQGKGSWHLFLFLFLFLPSGDGV